MKIVSLHAAMPAFEQGLNNVSQILRNTFYELGVEVEEINLSLFDIHFFDGIKSQSVENILHRVSVADGVIFESTSVLSMPCGILQTFIEHLGYGIYKNVFQGKKCFCVTVSRDGSEKKACDRITDVISYFGVIVKDKINILQNDAVKAMNEPYIREAVEKYAEDLYRILKQDRNFIIPQGKMAIDNGSDFNFNENANKIISEPKAKKIKTSEILREIDYSEFDARQEEDIKEISKILTSQYNNEKSDEEKGGNVFFQQGYQNYYQDLNGSFSNVVPHIKSCQQRTQSLYHYFQPQLSSGIEAVIQINVKGDEKFEGYLVIRGGNCEYFDGVHENPDVTVFSDCSVWLDILNGKYTIQKAFMIGQLKVRGNFVLMTKFDQLFKIPK